MLSVESSLPSSPTVQTPPTSQWPVARNSSKALQECPECTNTGFRKTWNYSPYSHFINTSIFSGVGIMVIFSVMESCKWHARSFAKCYGTAGPVNTCRWQVRSCWVNLLNLLSCLLYWGLPSLWWRNGAWKLSFWPKVTVRSHVRDWFHERVARLSWKGELGWSQIFTTGHMSSCLHLIFHLNLFSQVPENEVWQSCRRFGSTDEGPSSNAPSCRLCERSATSPVFSSWWCQNA